MINFLNNLSVIKISNVSSSKMNINNCLYSIRDAIKAKKIIKNSINSSIEIRFQI